VITVSEIKEEGGLQRIDLKDRLDRKSQPERVMLGLRSMNLIGGWGVGIRLVPPDFWTLDGQNAIVACPCGETPAPLALGPMIECGCGRFFFFEGSDVWSFGSPGHAEKVIETADQEI
jgi:hypothetical protein